MDQDTGRSGKASEAWPSDHMDGYLSPTLQALEPHQRPVHRTVCEQCPNSMWFSSLQEAKCYCRLMHAVTWSTREPIQLTHCDGMML